MKDAPVHLAQLTFEQGPTSIMIEQWIVESLHHWGGVIKRRQRVDTTNSLNASNYFKRMGWLIATKCIL